MFYEITLRRCYSAISAEDVDFLPGTDNLKKTSTFSSLRRLSVTRKSTQDFLPISYIHMHDNSLNMKGQIGIMYCHGIIVIV